MAVAWDDKFSVGSSDIDAQHKRLFQLTNKLETLLNENKGNLLPQYNQILRIIDELGDYSAIHFYSEELAMEECNCPDLDDHKAKHQSFAEEVHNLKENLSSDILFKKDEKKLTELLERLFNFLSKWLTGHILVVDMQYKGKIKGL